MRRAPCRSPNSKRPYHKGSGKHLRLSRDRLAPKISKEAIIGVAKAVAAAEGMDVQVD